MATMREMIEDAILEVRQRMLDDGEAESFLEINRGLCEDLAMEAIDLVERRAGGEGRDLGLTDCSIGAFIEVDPRTGFAYDDGGPFDRELIARHYPLTAPPEGMTWDDMDAVSGYCGINGGSHIVVEHEARFYDAEVPEGVDNLFDLPYMQRLVAKWTAAREAAADTDAPAL